MVARQPTGNDWLGRFLPLLVSTLLGLCSTGLVFYFSSQRATLDQLQAQISATSESVHLLKQEMDMNKARRDEQINALSAQMGRRR